MVEVGAEQTGQQPRLELKVDLELDPGPGWILMEAPAVFQLANLIEATLDREGILPKPILPLDLRQAYLMP